MIFFSKQLYYSFMNNKLHLRAYTYMVKRHFVVCAINSNHIETEQHLYSYM